MYIAGKAGKYMKNKNKQDDLTYLLIFLWKWKKMIFGAGFIAAILVGIITSPFVTRPKYEAVSILFATRSSSPEKLMDEQEFGYDIDADRLLQILESRDLQDSIAKMFKLPAHYDINKNDKQWRDKLKSEFNSRVSFSRTKYMSIVISVLDTDPELAAKIANAIPAIADKLREDILKKNAKSALDVAEKEYRQKLEIVENLRAQVDELKRQNSAAMTSVLSEHYNEKQQSVKKLRQTLDEYRNNYNIYDYGAQVNILNKQLAQAKSTYQQEKGKLSVYEKSLQAADTLLVNTKARLEGANQQMESIQKNLSQLSGINKEYLGLMDKLNSEQNILNQVQPEYEKMQYSFEPIIASSLLSKLTFSYNVEMNLLNEIIVKYEKAKHNYNMPVARAYVVSKAEPSYKKKFPQTTLSVCIAFILSSLMAVVTILVSEKISSIKHQILLQQAGEQVKKDKAEKTLKVL